MEYEWNHQKLADGDYFDFYEASENYGFDFELFIEENFSKFIKETYLRDYMEMRKNYIKGNLENVKFYAHKFKGIFKLMMSSYVYVSCEKLQDSIETGAIYNDDLYINTIVKMQEFLKRLVLFSHRIEYPIDKQLLSQFWKENSMYDQMECPNVKDRLLRKSDTTVSTSMYTDGIELTNATQRSCCSYGNACLIF